MITQILDTLQPTVLMVFMVVLLSYCYLRRQKNLPPGPRGLPLIGSILSLGKNIAEDAMKISKEYDSDVICIRMGPIYGIFLNSYDAIKEALSSEDFMDRPEDIFMAKYVTNGLGVGTSNGQLWKEHRRLTLSFLRDFGMGKMGAEDKIRSEISELIKEIKKIGSKPFDVTPMLTISAANIICLTVFGKRYSYDDKEFLHYSTRFSENTKLIGPSNPLNGIHWLRHLPGDFFHFKKVMKNIADIHEFLDKQIKDHQEAFDPANIGDFLDAYILEKKHQDARNPDNTFTDLQLKNVMSDLYIAGTETSATTVTWGLLYLIANPDIQEKIHKEIDDNIGRDRAPTMMDKKMLQYTDATILEVHRLSTIAAVAPHGNIARDVQFRGFTIPKGSFVFPNIYAVHRDPKFWTHPEEFHPEHFLDENGQVCMPKGWIPFALGRRQCPGESLAKMEVFLVLTSLLQKFKFSLPEGSDPPDIEGTFGLTRAPKPFELCVTEKV